MQIGQLVKDKQGKYKDKYFIVIKLENDFAYLSDGKLRKLDKLKKKNVKHLQKINIIMDLQNFDDNDTDNAKVKKYISENAKNTKQKEVIFCQKMML